MLQAYAGTSGEFTSTVSDRECLPLEWWESRISSDPEAAARSTPGVRVVQLTVTESNLIALQLYQSCGFEPWGTEPYAIKVDGPFVAKVHMWYQIGPDAA